MYDSVAEGRGRGAVSGLWLLKGRVCSMLTMILRGDLDPIVSGRGCEGSTASTMIRPGEGQCLVLLGLCGRVFLDDGL